MAAKFDESEFIDTDYESSKQSLGVGTVTTTTMTSLASSNRPPSREEIEAKVSDAHARLAELKRAQEQLERERASLEESLLLDGPVPPSAGLRPVPVPGPPWAPSRPRGRRGAP